MYTPLLVALTSNPFFKEEKEWRICYWTDIKPDTEVSNTHIENNIKISDIKDDSLKILGKGNKERIIYLNNACIDAINDYLKDLAKLQEEKKNQQAAQEKTEEEIRQAEKEMQEINDKIIKATDTKLEEVEIKNNQ